MAEDRREFLGRLTGAVGAALGGAVAVPVVGALAHPLRSDSIASDAEETPLGPAERFEVGLPTKVAVQATRRDAWQTTVDVTIGSVWVVRTGEQPATFRVLSTTCPHLGCSVNAVESGFHCPCHNSPYAADGTRVIPPGGSTPAPRDMDALEHEVRDGVLYCRYVRYKPGLRARVRA